VVIVAIVLGRRLRVRMGSFGVGVDEPNNQKVDVANDVMFENAKVGNVTGSSDSAKEVNVMNRAVVHGGEIGDITGTVISGKEPDEIK
jgi:hypothetical protein